MTNRDRNSQTVVKEFLGRKMLIHYMCPLREVPIHKVASTTIHLRTVEPLYCGHHWDWPKCPD